MTRRERLEGKIERRQEWADKATTKSEQRFTPGDPLPFAGIHLNVMQGARCVARACSHTMAKRISRALNNHTPNSRGY